VQSEFYDRFILFNIAKYGSVTGDPVAEASVRKEIKAQLAKPVRIKNNKQAAKTAAG
jgi:hypothetical protein